MLVPSIFSDNFFDDFFEFPFIDDRAEKNAERKLYGHHAANLMKTDIKETEVFNLHIAACHHNAGYTVGDEHIEIFGFFLRLIFRVAEQNLVAPLCRRALECTDHFTEKRVRDVRNDNPDRIGMRFCQGTRQLIRLVIHLLHRLRYFFSCLFTDVSAVVDHAGNRRRRNAGACRYVLDCRHVSLLVIF